MIKYKVMHLAIDEDLEEKLNELAGDGWRVISSSHSSSVYTTVILERVDE